MITATAAIKPHPLPPDTTPSVGVADPCLITMDYEQPSAHLTITKAHFGGLKLRLEDQVSSGRDVYGIKPVTLADGSTSVERAIDPVGSYDDAVTAAASIARTGTGAVVIQLDDHAKFGVAKLSINQARSQWLNHRTAPDARTESRRTDWEDYAINVHQHVRAIRGDLTYEDVQAGTLDLTVTELNSVNNRHVTRVAGAADNIAAFVDSTGVYDLRHGDLESESGPFTDAERFDFPSVGMSS